VSDEHNDQPIIVKRRKKGHGDHHGGAWKVAFADFMTAMMAFFLVMWLVGQKDEVRQAVAGYFRDPGKFAQQGQSGVLKGSSSTIDNTTGKMGLVNKKSTKEYIPSPEEKKLLSKAAENIMKQLATEKVFGKLKDNIKVQLTSEGLRIILNESEDSPAFFEPGSAKLLQKSAIILVTIAEELGKIGNRLVVEGHTDSSPSGDNVYTNWELSSDRANAARALMEVSGLWDGQVREVRGFANKFPMIEDDPTDSRNRRVTILVLYESRERQFDEIEVGADLMQEIEYAGNN
jgi:chemotaxis protein MotB